MDIKQLIDKIDWGLIIGYGLKLTGAILVWIIGSWLIKKVMKQVARLMDKRDYEISLKKFLLNLISWTLKIVLVLAILGTLGIETTSFAAIIAAAGLAIGMALQGSLANFAGGTLIMIFKPFKIGDFIEAQGVSGTVKEIGIFTTTLNTFGNQLAIIPNGKLSNENIINYSAEDTRRDNLTIGIGYSSDIKKAKSILLAIANDYSKILKDPAPQVFVAELADSSVNFTFRFWAKNEDFWDCHFYAIEEVKTRFDAEGIEIPYPHQVEIQK
ncbi:mechanosensitive ion channel [Zhouia spongiae]|uniref:Mechanosensitive ion channel n=1 Tax=Zhouia spongiae TaxID=2202721 RepID=A0ABY3YN31_9FLAO|nr:mechanosensitive ion channel domain-containing protein [Zhouia spongiae]UNY99240.1 mechanosensitive ion channel [Zhouia spongiae]